MQHPLPFVKTRKSSTILVYLPGEQGLTRYWHMGRRRKARATVAITAVQTANNS